MKSVLLILFIGLTCSLEIIFNNNETKTIAFSNSTISEMFMSDLPRSYCSDDSYLYYEGLSSNKTNTTIKGDDFKLLNISSTSLFTSYYKYNADTLMIHHYCHEETIPSGMNITMKETSSNSAFYILSIHFIYNNSDYKLDFVKYCSRDFSAKIWTEVLIFSIALITVYFGSRTEDTYTKTLLRENGVREEDYIVRPKHILFFICFGSIMLIVLFYLIKYIHIILELLFSFYSFISLYSFFRNNFSNSLEKYFSQKVTKDIIFVTSVSMVIYWFWTKDWLMNDIIALTLAFIFPAVIQIRSYKICFLLLIAIFVFDVYWVFFSERTFKANVMAQTAVSINVPNVIKLPVFSSDPNKSCSMLGMGDILIPTVLFKFFRNYDLEKTTGGIYHKVCMGLYALSLLLAGAILYIYQYPQPVFFYISPILIIGITSLAIIRKELSSLWKGIEAKPIALNDEKDSDVEIGNIQENIIN
jgi:hypothetical protein